MNRLMAALLLLTAALLGLLVTGVITGAGQATAVPHPDFAPMQRGIDGGTLGAPLWSGYAVGLLIIAMMWITMLVGFKRRHWVVRVVTVWTALYALSFVGLMRSYQAYDGGETLIAAGFTRPAAWLTYGMMLFPWVLLLIITYAFESAYFGPEDQGRFDALVAESGSAGSAESTDGDR